MSSDVFLLGDSKTPIFSQINLKNYFLKLLFHCYLWGISRFNHLSLPDLEELGLSKASSFAGGQGRLEKLFRLTCASCFLLALPFLLFLPPYG